MIVETKSLADYSPEEIEKARQEVLKRQERGRRSYEEHKPERLVCAHRRYQEHGDVVRESNRQSYEKHRPKRLEHVHQYQQEHKDEMHESHRQNYENHKLERLEYMRRYYEANRDKVKETVRQYRESHEDEIRKRRHQYNETHREEINVRWCQRNKERPEIVKAVRQRRRARMMGSNNHFTATEFKTLCDAFENKCFYCKQALPLTPDHAIPLSRGGDNSIDNIVPSCMSCNSKKNTKTLDEYVNQLSTEAVV